MAAQNPAQRRASEAAAAWLAANHKNHGWLAQEAKADPGTIGDFLAGKRWPKLSTQGRIEDALGWPAGIIHQIGMGAEVPESLVERAAVSGRGHDAGYVAAPGDLADGGSTDDEVLESIRAMREDMRAMRDALERMADRA